MIRVNQIFYDVLVSANLRCVYHMIEAIQCMKDPRCNWKYHSTQCTVTMCASFHFVCDLKTTEI